MHKRVLGRQFKKAERKHVAAFQANGKAINDTLVGRALVGAKEAATDPFFKASVDEAAALARPGEFDTLALITDSYPLLRRYAPALRDRGLIRSELVATQGRRARIDHRVPAPRPPDAPHGQATSGRRARTEWS